MRELIETVSEVVKPPQDLTPDNREREAAKDAQRRLVQQRQELRKQEIARRKISRNDKNAKIRAQKYKGRRKILALKNRSQMRTGAGRLKGTSTYGLRRASHQPQGNTLLEYGVKILPNLD